MKKIILSITLATTLFSAYSMAEVSIDKPAEAPPVSQPIVASGCKPEDKQAIQCASSVLAQMSYYGHTGLCNLESYDNGGQCGWRFEALQVRPDLETQIRFSCLPYLNRAFQACGF